MAAMTMACGLAAVERLTGEFVTVITVIVGAFVAGNAYEHSRKDPDVSTS